MLVLIFFFSISKEILRRVLFFKSKSSQPDRKAVLSQPVTKIYGNFCKNAVVGKLMSQSGALFHIRARNSD